MKELTTHLPLCFHRVNQLQLVRDFVLNMHRLFFLSLFPKEYIVTTVSIVFALYQLLVQHQP
jgi:hypothetical protein